MNTGNYHVLPHLLSGWMVKKEGAARASRLFENQNEAIIFARKLCKQNRSELIVHGRNGEIRMRDTYGRDPFPPRG